MKQTTKFAYEINLTDYGSFYVFAENSIEAIEKTTKSFKKENPSAKIQIHTVRLLGKAIL